MGGEQPDKRCTQRDTRKFRLDTASDRPFNLRTHKNQIPPIENEPEP
jgi:hypothetical protein